MSRGSGLRGTLSMCSCKPGPGVGALGVRDVMATVVWGLLGSYRVSCGT